MSDIAVENNAPSIKEALGEIKKHWRMAVCLFLIFSACLGIYKGLKLPGEIISQQAEYEKYSENLALYQENVELYSDKLEEMREILRNTPTEDNEKIDSVTKSIYTLQSLVSGLKKPASVAPPEEYGSPFKQIVKFAVLGGIVGLCIDVLIVFARMTIRQEKAEK